MKLIFETNYKRPFLRDDGTLAPSRSFFVVYDSDTRVIVEPKKFKGKDNLNLKNYYKLLSMAEKVNVGVPADLDEYGKKVEVANKD